MKLSSYIVGLEKLVRAYDLKCDLEISHVANDSRRIGKGGLFCAVRGEKSDGHKYIEDVISNGASALIVADDFDVQKLPCNIPYIVVSDSYYAWGIICEEFFGKPASSFDCHTVTGTNGKTTIAFILKHLFDIANGSKTALQTTVITDTLSGKVCDSENTTPDAYNLQRLFNEMKSNGAKALAIEYSSHGLSQHRAGNTLFSSAIFTNLTGDHLDYHKTMENYYLVKKSLFSNMMKPDAPCVVNIDDAYGKRLIDELNAESDGKKRILCVSKTDDTAFCFIKSFKLYEGCTDINVVIDGHELAFTSRLTGEHNIYNLVSAMTAVYASGVSIDQIADGAKNAPAAPGRLQEITLEGNVHAFVDYAHTDDALSRVIDSLHAIKKSTARIITVFGCGGDRDVTKRPRMGNVAAQKSDIAIVTSDNPRTESPEKIISDILEGIPSCDNVIVIPDRASAIIRAVELAKVDDIILVAGKGHENYQIIGNTRHSFSDADVLYSTQK